MCDLLKQLTVENLIEDYAGNEPNDEDDSFPSDESSDEECATAPHLQLSNGDRIKLLLLLLATKKRHNVTYLTYGAAESLVKFSGLLNKNQDTFSATKHLMKDAITAYSSDLTLHYLCSKCGFYIGRQENTITSDNCHQAGDPNECKKVKSSFLNYSVKEQIKALLESGLEPHLMDPHDRSKMCQFNYEDVFDGKMYKRLVSSTSKFSAWPVLLTINELPLHLRRKFVMMASVWLNKKKPEINQYMKPLVEECVDMLHNGIDYKVNGLPKNKQIVDLMGWLALFLGIPSNSMFNGKHGCGLCYHPGYRLRYGRGTTRSYSLRNGDFPMRSHEETIELARDGDRTGIFQRGIRGSSISSNIPNFDIVHGLDLDIFHCLVNVAKRFTTLMGLWSPFGYPHRFRNSGYGYPYPKLFQIGFVTDEHQPPYIPNTSAIIRKISNCGRYQERADLRKIRYCFKSDAFRVSALPPDHVRISSKQTSATHPHRFHQGNLWIGKKRLNEPCNVHDRLSIIDRRLLAITTTDDISRAPRSLTERSDFRGHKWFNWVLFYSLPVLKNILPAIYLNHWSLLVHAIGLMMQNSVAKTELLYAGRYLKQFNQEIDLLYGSVHVTFSVHLLTHLENSVMNFAQPWTHSAFTYESFLGELKDSV
ncbi:Zinc finger protein 568 [Frankliniella fusca]|uniref:Zinc finger protein 568 n=1 Tax=Frankliniella fusca TaxID=407009 RepID=A0AAE1GUL8_9NEOP|nr:Zinc finger protein 568 [Frankliniella fusca]